MTDLDPAAIMAAHPLAAHLCYGWDRITTTACEPRRLAEALRDRERDLAAERAKVQDIVRLAREWIDCGSLGSDHGRELLIRLGALGGEGAAEPQGWLSCPPGGCASPCAECQPDHGEGAADQPLSGHWLFQAKPAMCICGEAWPHPEPVAQPCADCRWVEDQRLHEEHATLVLTVPCERHR